MPTLEQNLVRHRRRSPRAKPTRRLRATAGSHKFPVNHSRWYDSTTGRWLSQDPIGFAAGCTNLYCYCGNGPIDGVDPSGMLYVNIWNPTDGWGHASITLSNYNNNYISWWPQPDHHHDWFGQNINGSTTEFMGEKR